MKNLGVAQRGVALIAVLWLVAAMSLIITGITQAVRSEARTVGLQRQALLASAWADAAILLALQNMQAQKKEPNNTVQLIPVHFGGRTGEVSVRPLNGLIDINNASILLLADLYRHAGEMSPDAAQALAQATSEARESRSTKGLTSRFEATEDLLRVPGMTYGLYAKISNLITADLPAGNGRVNPLAAPVGVLQVLTGGDIARAAAVANRRDADPNLMDTSFLNPAQIDMASSSSLQLRVRVNLPDGGALQKSWHILWSIDPRSGLPWRVLGTQQSMQRATQPDI